MILGGQVEWVLLAADDAKGSVVSKGEEDIAWGFIGFSARHPKEDATEF